MPIPPYTIPYILGSTSTTLAGQHLSPARPGMSGVYIGSYDPVLSTYQSLGGPDRTSSQVGLTDTPCLNGTSSLGVHPYEASRGLLHSYVPATH